MYKLHKLSSGMDLILINRNSMRSAAVLFCVKAGSVHETNENSGVSHFIEHTVFRKTKNRDIVQIKKPIEEIGGTINAFTSRNITVFYSKVPEKEVELAIDTLSDITFHASLDEEDIEKERSIILEEIAMYEDDPVDNTFENLFKHVYDENFGRPILGSKKNVKEFNHKKVYEYYEKYYVPQNTVAVVSGKFNEKEIIEKFENIKCLRNGETNIFKSPILKQENVFVKKTKRDLNQVYIINGFEAPAKNSKLYFPTLVLNTLLGSGMSSLLFNDIREKTGLVYEVATDYNAYSKSGLFVVFAATSEDKQEKFENKLKGILETIDERKDIEDWVEYGKKRISGKLTLDIESNVSMGMNSLDLYLSYDRIVNIDEIIENISKVTVEDVKNVAKKIFLGRKYVSVLKPETD